MRFTMLSLSLVLGLSLVGHWSLQAGAPEAKPPVKREFGLEKRVLWTTSKVQGTPDPLPPYLTEVAFPNLRFDEPLTFAVAPGQDRIFIAERKGKIRSFPNRQDADQTEQLIDIGRTIYGLAFHPKFQKNGYFYVTNVAEPDKPSPRGTRISRYKTEPGQPLKADPATETVIIEWPSGGHNGGCLKFGPDGFLYICAGDGSGIADELQTGQDLSDLLASILRIDVDHPAPGKEYGIPADNPFVGVPDARPEIWAYGLRQAWKFGFDRDTGDLWAGEVGQDLWEAVHLIRRGGNYGWSVQESAHPFRPERKLGPSPIIPAIVEHHHVDFRSVTGGFVYHGRRLPELEGAYIYGDYDTGRIWSVRYDGNKVTEHRELADTTFRIVEWGEDPAGELYFVDHIGGQLHQLIRAPAVAADTPKFPRKLSETGLFASTKDHQAAPGLIPYSVNSQLWSDFAIKERFLALPGNAQIDYNAIEYPQPAPGAPRGWRFPDGTVVVKTFSMEMERGNPQSARRLETRLLHLEQVPGTQEMGDQVWRGYTYIWNEDQTDAELAPKEGVDRLLSIADKEAPGGTREQTWHFPSRAECSLCHTTPAKYVLGINTLQMNRDHNYDGVVANQLATWEHIGLFSKHLPDAPDKLPRLADYNDPHAPLSERARAYLHSNCSHCHMKWGGGNAEFQLLATLDLANTGTVGVRPAHGNFKLDHPEIIVPGHPERSMVYERMKILGLGRMPHIASTVVDSAAVKLIHDWLESLPADAGSTPKKAGN